MSQERANKVDDDMKYNYKEFDVLLKGYYGTDPCERLPFGFYEKFKMIFFVLSGIMLIKVILIIILMSVTVIIAYMIAGCKNSKKAVSFALKMSAIMVRSALFVCGFYYIPVKKSKKSNLNCPVIICNHVSMWDPFILYTVVAPKVVSQKKIENFPIFGKVLKILHTIWVERETREKRKASFEKIKNYIKNYDKNDINYRPMMIFPGSCSINQNTIPIFKAAAFSCGTNVCQLNYIG